MIGNDIVDLLQASLESRWPRKGYLDKLFSHAEQSQILSAIEPSATLWTLWSCKEAVYKIVHRLSGIRSYAPLSFSCKAGIVTHAGQSYYCRTIRQNDCIHTIAVQNRQLFEQVRMGFNLDTVRPLMQKNAAGIPSLNNKPLSISHHGRYAAWVSL